MISYKLKSTDGTRAVYVYSIEGDASDVGIAILDIEDNTCEIAEPAPSDKAMGYPWHGAKMRHALAECRRLAKMSPLSRGIATLHF